MVDPRPFKRTVINPRERPLSSDINAGASAIDAEVRHLVRQLFASRFNLANPVALPTFGLFNNGLRVVPSAGGGMAVDVTPGLGYMTAPTDVPTDIGGAIGVNDTEAVKPVFLSAVQTLALAAAPSAGLERYDLIEVAYARVLGEAESRDVFDAGTEQFVPTLVNKALSFDLLGQTGAVVSPAASTAALSVKRGVAATTGTAAFPAVTSGYQPLAYVHVLNGAVSIVAADIADYRRLVLGLSGKASIGCTYRQDSTGKVYMGGHSAPPGTLVAVRARNFGGVFAATLYLMVGGKPAEWADSRQVRAVASARCDNGVATRFAVVKTSCSAVIVDAALQTALADAGETSDPITVAVGQPLIAVTLTLVQQSAGTTSQSWAETGDPATIDVVVDFVT